MLLLLGTTGVMLCWIHEIWFHSGASKLASLIILLMLSFTLAKRFTESFISLKTSVNKTMAAEVAFMQAQIKPHFLYNTLNTISAFCDTDPEKAQKLIDDFSNYLRKSFDFKRLEVLVPLERELSLVQSYIMIEKARFGDELKIKIDVDETIRINIPLLSIQPLVENAINHGIRKKINGGTLTLEVKKIVGGVRITVADDGQGMLKEKLKTLLLTEDTQGIGLWNIDKRLKKLYGKGLEIESIPDIRTTVSYVIPLEVR